MAYRTRSERTFKEGGPFTTSSTIKDWSFLTLTGLYQIQQDEEIFLGSEECLKLADTYYKGGVSMLEHFDPTHPCRVDRVGKSIKMYHAHMTGFLRICRISLP